MLANVLIKYFENGGPIMWPILITAIVAVAEVYDAMTSTQFRPALTQAVAPILIAETALLAGQAAYQDSLRNRVRGELVWLSRKAKARTRKALLTFGFMTLVGAVVLAVGTYKGVEYMESVEFCGTVCHTVMQPEYTAHQRSPHARVACADCHIGPGADWFVKSKMSGLRQVYAVTFNTHSRPIPSPRPALGGLVASGVGRRRPKPRACRSCTTSLRRCGRGANTVSTNFPCRTLNCFHFLL